MSEHNNSRRDFIKKAAYVAPVVLTLNALPTIASAGSVRLRCDNGGGNGGDCTNFGLSNGGAGSAHVDQDD